MGSFNIMCRLTNLPIVPGDEIAALPLEYNYVFNTSVASTPPFAGSFGYAVVPVLAYGTYGDAGELNIESVPTPAVLVEELHLGSGVDLTWKANWFVAHRRAFDMLWPSYFSFKDWLRNEYWAHHSDTMMESSELSDKDREAVKKHQHARYPHMLGNKRFQNFMGAVRQIYQNSDMLRLYKIEVARDVALEQWAEGDASVLEWTVKVFEFLFRCERCGIAIVPSLGRDVETHYELLKSLQFASMLILKKKEESRGRSD